MIPIFDFPGLINPGQFGPIIREFPTFCACAQKLAVSCTGIPSVITTINGKCASIASTTAPLANFGGTKITEAFAPVAATASAY